MKKVFSFDAETNGLWGQAFQLAAVVYDEQGNEIDRFSSRCGIKGETNTWVAENVLPAIQHIPESYGQYVDMVEDFATFYMNHKEGADVIAHMGYIVEAKVLRDMHDLGFIGDWDAPYPLLDVSGNLQQAGFNPTSCDEYAKSQGIELPKGTSHDAVYDCIVAAKVYRHLRGWV